MDGLRVIEWLHFSWSLLLLRWLSGLFLINFWTDLVVVEAYAPSMSTSPMTNRYNFDMCKQFFAGQQWQASIDCFAKGFTRQPTDATNADYLNHMGVAYYHLKNYTEAVAHYKRALETKSPSFGVIQFNMALSLMKLSRHRAAERAYLEAMIYHPFNAHYAFTMGEAYFAEKQYKRAAQYLRLGLAIAPTDSNRWNLLGVVSTESRKYSAAAFAYFKALQFDPNNAVINFNMGMACFHNKKAGPDRFADAAQFFQKSFDLDPTNALVAASLATTYFNSFRYENSSYYFQISIQLRTQAEEKRRRLGLSELDSNEASSENAETEDDNDIADSVQEGDDETEERDADDEDNYDDLDPEEASKRNLAKSKAHRKPLRKPDNKKAGKNKVVSEKGNHANLIAVAEHNVLNTREQVAAAVKYTSFDDRSGRWMGHHSPYFREQNRFKEIEGFYLKAMEFAPDQAVFYFNLGSLYVQQHLYLEALPYLWAAVLQEPNNDQYRGSLGLCYFEIGNFTSAERQFAIAAKLNPKSSEHVFNQGRCLASLKRHKRAIKAFEAAAAKEPENANILNWLATSYYHAGMYAEAEKVFTQATAADIYSNTFHYIIDGYFYTVGETDDYHNSENKTAHLV